jgi:hypothetical protein
VRLNEDMALIPLKKKRDEETRISEAEVTPDVRYEHLESSVNVVTVLTQKNLQQRSTLFSLSLLSCSECSSRFNESSSKD